jgi:hypothetical protein
MGMVRRGLLLSVFLAACTGCTSIGPYQLTPSTRPVPLDPAPRVLGEVSGRACATTLLFFIALSPDSSLDSAVKDALRAQQADALVDVRVDRETFNVLYLYTERCTVVRGTAVRLGGGSLPPEALAPPEPTAAEVGVAPPPPPPPPPVVARPPRPAPARPKAAPDDRIDGKILPSQCAHLWKRVKRLLPSTKVRQHQTDFYTRCASKPDPTFLICLEDAKKAPEAQRCFTGDKLTTQPSPNWNAPNRGSGSTPASARTSRRFSRQDCVSIWRVMSAFMGPNDQITWRRAHSVRCVEKIDPRFVECVYDAVNKQAVAKCVAAR